MGSRREAKTKYHMAACAPGATPCSRDQRAGAKQPHSSLCNRPSGNADNAVCAVTLVSAIFWYDPGIFVTGCTSPNGRPCAGDKQTQLA